MTQYTGHSRGSIIEVGMEVDDFLSEEVTLSFRRVLVSRDPLKRITSRN